MSSIEERAYNYSNGKPGGLFRNQGYIKGATDQQKIDIDKACEWLKENNGKRFNGFDIVYTQGWIEIFKQAIEADI